MIKKIAVIGAGTMGHSIALNFSIYGYDVNLYDTNSTRIANVEEEIKDELEFLAEEEFIEPSEIMKALSNIHYFTDLQEAVMDRDYVIEAAPEILKLKQELFQKLDEFCLDHTILASNTSSLNLESMMALISNDRRKKMIVNHWYNPGHIMPIVELSFFGNMPEDIYLKVEHLYKSINKQCVKVLKDVPGLVANRIQQERYFLLSNKELLLQKI